ETKQSIVSYPGGILSFVLVLLASQSGQAQFINDGIIKVDDKTILSVYEPYINKPSGGFTNDGIVYIFDNWNNDGDVLFSDKSDGQTIFNGKKVQKLEGRKITNFQDVIFDSQSDTLVSFRLNQIISVNRKAEFLTGIIVSNEDKNKESESRVIFNENAIHSDASDLSFVDGKVEKIGNSMFEFPVGNDLFFRPAFHAKEGTGDGNIYTAQYFHQNSDNQYKHASKEDSILLINDKEYWNVTQDEGADKIVLTLTLDSQTTPNEFLDVASGMKVVIVRWDTASSKWIEEKGEVSEPIPNTSKDAGYSQLLTAQVSGYGIFTMALVKDTEVKDDVIVYNAVSPNGDGVNDTFLIEGIKDYPDNSVEIYNRWGVKVYDAKSYNESDVMFRGYSDGRVTVNRGEKLPTGTYFYILRYTKGEEGKEKSGYLYINNQ
ncbi:gliding motility-associated C-terminal domain-containing protein, partial [Flavobacterium sp. AJR]|uniref:gliding motility-associated C-terminal domain-containing protein n=1 Tax=Flavobacterium sp. AJR TaxID=1979369 RepID=UPI000A3D6567